MKQRHVRVERVCIFWDEHSFRCGYRHKRGFLAYEKKRGRSMYVRKTPTIYSVLELAFLDETPDFHEV